MTISGGNNAEDGVPSKLDKFDMQCVNSVQYQIQHNGLESDPFSP